MKSIDIGVLYDTVTIQKEVPTTNVEVDKMVGETDAAVEGWRADCTARNFLPRLYSAVAEAFIKAHPEITDVKHQVTKSVPKTNADGTPSLNNGVPSTTDTYESDIRLLKRHSEASPAFRDEIKNLLQTTAPTLPYYDERSGGSGKLAQMFLDASNTEFQKGKAHVENLATAIESNVPNYKVQRNDAGEVEPEHLARGMAALNKHLTEQAKNQAKAVLASVTQTQEQAA